MRPEELLYLKDRYTKAEKEEVVGPREPQLRGSVWQPGSRRLLLYQWSIVSGSQEVEPQSVQTV
jgi:hypothetical protein